MLLAACASSASALWLRATAVTEAPSWARAVAMPWPRPRDAPTTMVFLSGECSGLMVVSPSCCLGRGSGGSGGAENRGLRLSDRGLLGRVGELGATDEGEDRR